jgi:hypothetical protein
VLVDLLVDLLVNGLSTWCWCSCRSSCRSSCQWSVMGCDHAASLGICGSDFKHLFDKDSTRVVRC